MKTNFLTLFAFLLLITSCSNQQKAERSVKSYLMENLDDPKSYESVSFREFGQFNMNQLYAFIKDSIVLEGTKNSILQLKHEIDSLSKINMDTTSAAFEKDSETDELNMYQQNIDRLKMEYKNAKFIILHEYRAKNKNGGLELKEYQFILDEKFEVLDKIE